MRRIHFILLFFSLLTFYRSASGQAENGNCFIKNFPPDYFSHITSSPQTFDIVQNEQGLIFIGNASEIFEVEGSSIRKVENAENLQLLSLIKGPEGRIYASGKVIGYIEADSLGKSRFHQLGDSSLLKPEGGMYSATVMNGTLYFQNGAHVLRYEKGAFLEYEAKNTFWRSHAVNGNYYVWQSDLGLMQVDGELISPAGTGENFSEKPISKILPFENQKSLVLTWNKGLFIWDGKESKPFETEIKSIIESAPIHDAVLLSDGNYAIATLGKGIFIIDNTGRLVQQINEASGLDNNKVHSLFEDNSGGLWVGMDKGFARIEISSPLRFYDKRNALQGICQSSSVYQGQLYCATTAGIFVMEKNGFSDQFRKFENILDGYFLLPFRDKLLIGGNEKVDNSKGLFSYDKEGMDSIMLFKDATVETVCKSKIDSNRLYLATGTELYSLIYKSKKEEWQSNLISEKKFSGIESLMEDEKGNLWISDEKGLHLLHLKNDLDKSDEVQTFQIEKVLVPEYEKIFLEKIGRKVLFLVNNRVLTFDEKPRKFTPHPVFDKLSSERKESVKFIKQSPDGIVWMANERHFGPIEEKDGNHLWKTGISNRLPLTSVWDMSPDEDGNIWCATSDGVYSYNSSYSLNNTTTFNTLIRNFSIGKDSVVFYGNGKQPHHQISYNFNNLWFEFSSTSYDGFEKNQYSYFLKGNDKGWSLWTNENKKEYTNLSPGDYTFRVKSQNTYGEEGEEASYHFTILPPWYMTWWAYGLYGLSAIILFFGGVKLNSRRLEREKQVLEDIISERTTEIVRQKDEISLQKKELDDSIDYARNIQQAILPDKSEIGNSLPDHFVFFQPKEVVSGDFYWFHDNGEKVFIIAADCTGHGVPGAFVSMVGNNLLNQIIIEKKITKPGRILTQLNTGVNIAFKRKGSASHANDGMDISVCVVDKKNRMMEFAGAKNHLIQVRNGDVLVTKADNTPIGGRTSMNYNFTNHRVEVKEKDAFYIFSDGYPDQFGGPKGKKFMIKRFRKMLSEIYDQPFDQQKQHLHKTFKNWTGNEEQIDDVLVIGFNPF